VDVDFGTFNIIHYLILNLENEPIAFADDLLITVRAEMYEKLNILQI